MPKKYPQRKLFLIFGREENVRRLLLVSDCLQGQELVPAGTEQAYRGKNISALNKLLFG